jgi:hypothetical protein
VVTGCGVEYRERGAQAHCRSLPLFCSTKSLPLQVLCQAEGLRVGERGRVPHSPLRTDLMDRYGLSLIAVRSMEPNHQTKLIDGDPQARPETFVYPVERGFVNDDSPDIIVQ